MEEQTVGIGNMLLHLLVDTCILHHRGVRTAIGHGGTTCDDVRGHVVRECTASLDQREVASTGIGILDGSTGEDDAIADHTVASHLRAVAEHTVRAHHRIVADVGTFEQEVVVTNDGAAVALGTTVDDYVLADHVVIADPDIRLGASEVEVLRQGCDDTALVDLVVVADAGAAADADEGEDDTVVANLHIVLDIHKGEYLTVVADFRIGADLGLGTNFACHNSKFLIRNS